MKTAVTILSILVLLALDWAALHDIQKGEENLQLEYGMLVFSAVAIASILIWRFRSKAQNQSNPG